MENADALAANASDASTEIRSRQTILQGRALNI
jgi:hypothetical protein